jgi:ATP-dependent Clp protease ATP-binding subunit ClpX
MLSYDNVALEFTDEALEAIADKAVEKEIGARGLRSVMESTMQNIMFTTPSDKTIEKVIVTKECVEGTAEPTVIRTAWQ